MFVRNKRCLILCVSTWIKCHFNIVAMDDQVLKITEKLVLKFSFLSFIVYLFDPYGCHFRQETRVGKQRSWKLWMELKTKF